MNGGHAGLVKSDLTLCIYTTYTRLLIEILILLYYILYTIFEDYWMVS
jgi:hypothetical protein